MISVLWPMGLILLLCVVGIPSAVSVLFVGTAALLVSAPAKMLLAMPGTLSVSSLNYASAIIPILLLIGATLQHLGTVQTFPPGRKADDERGAWFSGGMLGAPLPIAVSLVFLCLLTDTSINRSILNGLLPGLVLSLAYLGILIVAGLRGADLDLRRPDGAFSAGLILSRIFVPLVAMLVALLPLASGLATPLEAASLVAALATIFVLFVAGFSSGGWRCLALGLLRGVQGFGIYFLLMFGLMMFGFALRFGEGLPTVAGFLTSAGMGSGALLVLICGITALIGFVVGPLAAVGLVTLTTMPALTSAGIDLVQVVIALFLTAEAVRVGPRLNCPGSAENPATSWPHYIAALIVTLGYAVLPGSLAMPFQF